MQHKFFLTFAVLKMLWNLLLSRLTLCRFERGFARLSLLRCLFGRSAWWAIAKRSRVVPISVIVVVVVVITIIIRTTILIVIFIIRVVFFAIFLGIRRGSIVAVAIPGRSPVCSLSSCLDSCAGRYCALGGGC